jgi:hypothetical protein
MRYGIISTHADKFDIQQGRWRVTTLAHLYEWPLRFPVEQILPTAAPSVVDHRSGRGLGGGGGGWATR